MKRNEDLVPIVAAALPRIPLARHPIQNIVVFTYEQDDDASERTIHVDVTVCEHVVTDFELRALQVALSARWTSMDIVSVTDGGWVTIRITLRRESKAS